MIENLIDRSPTLEDAKQTLELLNRCDIAEYGEPDSAMEDLLNDWNNIDLRQDAWLVFTPEQNLIGYAGVVPWGPDLKYDLYVDPTLAAREIIFGLLTRCEARGIQLVMESDATNKRQAKCYVAHVNQQVGSILVELGFQTTKHIFNMQARFDAPPPLPQWPTGTSVRIAIPEQDDREIYEVIQSAFERPGRTAPSFEDWKGFMLRPDIFKPELWFLAIKGEEIVGACLSYEYSNSAQGWVRQLGVLESVRRTGLGSALLQHAFIEFYTREFKKVGLAVQSDNLRAIRFYENAGMKEIRRYDEYSKAIESQL
jgi:ribosomal protein S18 acetylase RimI-like enzyme